MTPQSETRECVNRTRNSVTTHTHTHTLSRTKDAVGVKLAGLPQGLAANGDKGVDRVGDDADHGARASTASQRMRVCVHVWVFVYWSVCVRGRAYGCVRASLQGNSTWRLTAHDGAMALRPVVPEKKLLTLGVSYTKQQRRVPGVQVTLPNECVYALS